MSAWTVLSNWPAFGRAVNSWKIEAAKNPGNAKMRTCGTGWFNHSGIYGCPTDTGCIGGC